MLLNPPLWLLLLLPPALPLQAGSYQTCSRGACSPAGDAAVEWQFDQPLRLPLTPQLVEELSVGERLHIQLPAQGWGEQEEQEVPAKVHMVWLGSPLPSRYWPGPESFATINPGEWSSLPEFFLNNLYHHHHPLSHPIYHPPSGRLLRPPVAGPGPGAAPRPPQPPPGQHHR